MSGSITESVANSGTVDINSLQGALQQTLDLQNNSLTEIQEKNQELNEKRLRQIEQMKEIEEKEKLILTRSRMLQIAQERNSYKKKIIYSLIAAILAIFIFTILMYVFYSRKLAGVAKGNGGNGK